MTDVTVADTDAEELRQELIKQLAGRYFRIFVTGFQYMEPETVVAAIGVAFLGILRTYVEKESGREFLQNALDSHDEIWHAIQERLEASAKAAEAEDKIKAANPIFVLPNNGSVN